MPPVLHCFLTSVKAKDILLERDINALQCFCHMHAPMPYLTATKYKHNVIMGN